MPRPDYAGARRAVGCPMIRVAAEARVSETTLRLFERDPTFVVSEVKRRTIAQAYVTLGILKVA